MTESVIDRTDSIEIKKDKSDLLPETIEDDQAREVITGALSEVKQFPGLPMQLIGKYAQIAAWGHGT